VELSPGHTSPVQLSPAEAEELGVRLQQVAVRRARIDHDFCDLVDQFDAGDGFAAFDGVRSTAHFLGWACGLGELAAREHVRVARALRQMPRTKELFAAGRFSYSKVRELTRLVGVLDEERMTDLALKMTASQLARTVAGYRLAAGSRIAAAPTRRYSSRPSVDGMVRISITLPAEEAALIEAAVEAACRIMQSSDDGQVADNAQGADGAKGVGEGGQESEADVQDGLPGADHESALGTDPDTGRDTRWEPPDRVQGLVDVATAFLDQDRRAPEDDHTLVVVHVDASILEATPAAATQTESGPVTEPVPAGTPEGSPAATRQTEAQAGQGTEQGESSRGNSGNSEVPGSSGEPAESEETPIGQVLPGLEESGPITSGPVTTGLPVRGLCTVDGQGPIEAATAQRLSCTASLQGVIRDKGGNVLALGRTRRLASRAQRRALRIRDHHVCGFPGCTRTHHLEAHHVVAWSAGGPTDLDNLILVCRAHHMLVHEGGISIEAAAGSGPSRWAFRLPDGRLVQPERYPVMADADDMIQILGSQAGNDRRERGGPFKEARPREDMDAEEPIDPNLIYPEGGGEGFDLHACVRVLFDLTLEKDGQVDRAA
ncbi:HNH endonuclease, partial [Acidipropionibacterium jensenii]|uniref:HNH endonuclease n=1 Tax=Acidipropionibacterium jensenii TaxID=1749 RepID=UPI0026486386